MRKWENYGDVNFLTYGGSLIRPAWDEKVLADHPALKNQYEVLILTRNPDDECTVLAGIKQIDTGDYEDRREEISKIYGLTSDEDDLLFAVSCAEYIGLEPGLDTACGQRGMYSSADDFIMDEDGVAEWLKEMEVPEEWIC